LADEEIKFKGHISLIDGGAGFELKLSIYKAYALDSYNMHFTLSILTFRRTQQKSDMKVT
jgi:hypothetical protein